MSEALRLRHHPATVVAGVGLPSTRSAPVARAPTARRANAATCSTCFPTRRATCTWATPRRTRSATSIARYWQQRGYDVLHPIGWDSFGLPAENAAIKRNEHPADYTYANIETQAASFRRYAISFDWSRRLHTSDPEYYRWTQWLFLRFFERGLAYRKASAVNWCPHDQTVLANEQVIAGACERCGTAVTKKTLTQWYFKITEYADRLLDDMARARGRVARARADDAAQLDRPIDRRARRLRDRGPRRTDHGLHHPARHVVRRDLLRRRRGFAAGGGAVRARATRLRSTPTSSRCAGSPTSIACRPSGRRPASSSAGTRSTR